MALPTLIFSLTIKDLQEVQKKLNDPKTWTLFNKYYRAPKFLKPIIVDAENPVYPKLYTEVFQTKEEDKSCCVVSYASFNLNYPGSIKVISECLKKVGFKGHFLYRIGGWPNMEVDGFDLIDVPYGFKIKAIQEARRLGYRNIVWIDSSMRPVKKLDKIFDQVEKHGLFFNLNRVFTRLDSISKYILEPFNLIKEDLKKIRYVNTGVIGFNFAHDLTKDFFDKFYGLARKKKTFFNEYFEELPFSVLVKQMNLESIEYVQRLPLFQYINLNETFKMDAFNNYKATFVIDYQFSKKWHP